MSDTSFNTIIDTNNVQLGQVIRTNITDQGIFRVFYNDISGNMYSAVSRESNYKQVIYNSSQNRVINNINDPIVDNSGMNAPFYGGTYHENELKHSDNSSNFYVFRYPTTGNDLSNNNCDRGPISYFTDVQFQKYKYQGDLSNNGNKVIYNTEGYSSLLSNKSKISIEGGNSSLDYNYYEQVAFGHCTSENGGYALDISQAKIIATQLGLTIGDESSSPPTPFAGGHSTKGLFAYPLDHPSYPNMAFFGTGGTKKQMKDSIIDTTGKYRPGVPVTTTSAMYVPDLINLPYNSKTINTRGVTNKPLNGFGLDISYVRFITEPWQTDISTNVAHGPSNFNTQYYIASKRPNITIFDQSNNITNPHINNIDISDNDTNYKGRWSIYVDTKSQVYKYTPGDGSEAASWDLSGNDTSGNIYISRSNRATNPEYTHCLLEHFKNNSVLDNSLNDISNVFVDLDLDLSENAIDASFNNVYARPYFVIGSDASTNIVYGYAPYNLTDDNSSLVETKTFEPSSSSKIKYCKIKLDTSANDWSKTQVYMCYYLVENNRLGCASCNSSELDTIKDISFSANDISGGQYPSMDVDISGIPHIAFYGGEQIHYIKGEWGTNFMDSSDNWIHKKIDDVGPASGNYYTDLSNNQPISLKISPYDNSTHIAYQYKNADDDTFSLKYWTNSKNLKDISGVDTSLNYLGLHTYGKTIDISKASVEAYWDLSSSKCIFSRDYSRYDYLTTNTEVGLTTPEYKINQYITPYGARVGVFGSTIATSTGWKNGVSYKATHLDKIYIIAKVKTPVLTSTHTLFLIGSTPGGYVGGIKDGFPFFGIQGNLNSSELIGPFNDCSGICHQYRNNAELNTYVDISLNSSKEYELEYYYNKGNNYLSINVKSLDSGTGAGFYEFYDISQNGGFNMIDGNLSIGTESHTASVNPWTGTIYKMSIYATDISNIPQFDLSRNGEILDDCSGTKYSSFYDNSGNTGLVIEPSSNEYQITNAVNSLNNGDISGSSYIKSTILHDIYYYQRVKGQNFTTLTNQNIATTYSKQFITVMDKFTKLNDEYKIDISGVDISIYEIWAAGYSVDSAGIHPKIWESLDGGITWKENTNFTSITGKKILDLKTFIDTNNHRWVFICGENYMLQVSNDYNGLLGSNWMIIGDDKNSTPTKDPSGVSFNNSPYISMPRAYKNNMQIFRDLNSICVTNFSETDTSDDILNTSLGSNDHHFHLWVGTKRFENYEDIQYPIKIVVTTGSWDVDVYWCVKNSAGNKVIETSASYYPAGSGPPGAPYNQIHFLPAGSYTFELNDVFGDGWTGQTMTVTNISDSATIFGPISVPSGGAGNPGYGPLIQSFQIIESWGSQFNERYLGYRDLLIRGNYTDYSNNQLDYSYNIITDAIIDTSNNSNKVYSLDSFNTFSFGGDASGNQYNTEGHNYGIVTTDSYVYQTKNGGKNWEKRLGVDRIDLFGNNDNKVRGTWGSYVEKNQTKNNGNDFIYDNSGMYVQTSTEPWNGLPGLTLAYNNGDYDLSFTPLDSLDKKVITWDPSENSNSFWNVNIPDNQGVPALYREGGGNTIKVHIDDESSTKNHYKNKQKMWTFDFTDSTTTTNYDTESYNVPSLYLRDSELDDNWQRVIPSIVDPSLNTYSKTESLKWGGITPYNNDYAIVNLSFANNNNLISNINNDISQYVGFYKLSKVPFTPHLRTEKNPADTYSRYLYIDYLMDYPNGALSADKWKNRLNFEKLHIESHFEIRYKLGQGGTYGGWSTLENWWAEEGQSAGTFDPDNKYDEKVLKLVPGSVYQFRIRLKNDYGYSWYSNIEPADGIEMPSPTPTITNLTSSTKLFENIISWKAPAGDLDGQSVQSVYSYDISKQYFDNATNAWIDDISFSRFYSDLSGVLGESYGDLSGTIWTGPFDPSSGSVDPSSSFTKNVSFTDTDLSLNYFYQYHIKHLPLTPGNPFNIQSITTFISSGLPQYIDYSYNYQDASFNIIWTTDVDISNDTKVTWDISWQEIRPGNVIDNSGTVFYTDPNGIGAGEKRIISINLPSGYLLADSSYNFLIMADYSNNKIITDYSSSSVSVQETLYPNGKRYDPSYVNVYYNYQEPVVLNNIIYNSLTDEIDMSWNATSIPGKPYYYDISFSHTDNSYPDISYNFGISEGEQLIPPYNNGVNYFPGKYNVRIRSAYGNKVPTGIVDISSIFSDWSDPKILDEIPKHLPKNPIIELSHDDTTITLKWDRIQDTSSSFIIGNHPIPRSYYLIKNETSIINPISSSDLSNNIHRDNSSYIDSISTNRIYSYDLSANYN